MKQLGTLVILLSALISGPAYAEKKEPVLKLHQIVATDCKGIVTAVGGEDLEIRTVEVTRPAINCVVSKTKAQCAEYADRSAQKTEKPGMTTLSVSWRKEVLVLSDEATKLTLFPRGDGTYSVQIKLTRWGKDKDLEEVDIVCKGQTLKEGDVYESRK